MMARSVCVKVGDCIYCLGREVWLTATGYEKNRKKYIMDSVKLETVKPGFITILFEAINTDGERVVQRVTHSDDYVIKYPAKAIPEAT